VNVVSERVALRPAGAGRAPAHRPLFGPEPLVVLGAPRVPRLVTAGVRPDRHTCFGPRGAVLLGHDGPLWVCDTGHHRVLGWARLPNEDETPADWVLGQPTFQHEARNAGGDASALSLNVPTGICRFGARGLAVADAWNHRVLLWHEAPTCSGAEPDIVLGQRDFEHVEANRGRPSPGADGLFWPYGVACFEGWLYVADSENRRVCAWRCASLPSRAAAGTSHGQPAELVLGQRDFSRRDENAGGTPDRASMRWPHGITFWQGFTCVADAGNNRILLYRGLPESAGQPADIILGQDNEFAVDHNRAAYWPRANTLNMPYGIVGAGNLLVCADTANSRLLGYDIGDLATGAPARALSGQGDFHQKGDNRWSSAVADSFCWPYGVGIAETPAGAAATGQRGRVVVADSGNNRISVWELAP
jgi:hypothetical protein